MHWQTLMVYHEVSRHGGDGNGQSFMWIRYGYIRIIEYVLKVKTVLVPLASWWVLPSEDIIRDNERSLELSREPICSGPSGEHCP